MAPQQQEQESKTIPLKILVDKQSNKVVFVETTKDFVDTLFSFLSLPLATIVSLLATTDNNNEQQQKQQSESSPFLGNIKNLYQTVENLNSNDVWNNHGCKQMLLHPKNPCESLCMDLFLNINPSCKFYGCDSFSCNKITNYQNLACTCGMPANKEIKNLDYDAQKVTFDRECGPMFLVSDNLKIVASSWMTSMQMLIESGISNSTQLEEVTRDIGNQEILNLLKYALTSHEPLTNTILTSSSKIKDNPPYQSQSAPAIKVMPCTSDRSKMDIKVLQSKSEKNIIIAEANGDFVDFIFSLLTIPLGSIVKLLGANSFAGCVGNLYKSLENLDPMSVLLNPGITPEFRCPNQPLNIPHAPPPSTIYYYNNDFWDDIPDYSGGVISKSFEISYGSIARELAPREGAVGFVKRATLYGVEDELKVKPLAANSYLQYLNVLSLPLDDLEVKMISFGEAEALRFLGAFLTSKFTLTSGLQDIAIYYKNNWRCGVSIPVPLAC